ncbi:DUF7490 domain-containing protein [Methanolobus bombayensis]|uniref:DUF7490 domain-containing protein n=1 Tax=Methanolobus bombayensis TaxID=38023 RepID=UPI001AE168DA|nr:hypothetical protein [Methanolobus bombayensis]MBP1908428.1 hypothetical protein [Methanolobus bombayensis]
MKVMNLLLFFSIFVFCVSSGCINQDVIEETPHPRITNMDVMSTPANEEFELKVTAYIQNPLNTDTGSLSLKVKAKDPSTNLIIAEHEESVGYLKANEQSYKTISFNVAGDGDKIVLIELFEDGSLVDESSTHVRLVSEVTEEVPNVILTDLMIETIQATNYGEDIIFEASPGLYNQGEEANKITVVVTAIVDDYTRYTGSAIASNLEQSQKTRATVRMTVPADKSYSFNVDVIVDGEVTSSAQTTSSIKLHDLKLETPTTYSLVESSSPIAEEMPAEEEEESVEETTEEESPGFETPLFVVAILCAMGILRRWKKDC